jgi:hypothetical protein
VIPEEVSVVQHSLYAVADNTPTTTAYAKKTFCDYLWTMLMIHCSVVDRVVNFSSAIADKPPISVVPDPDAATRPSKKVSKKRFELHTLQNVPQENAGFIEA